MAAFLLGGELVFEVDRRRACLDHHLHELEGVERTAEACFRIRDDRREPVRIVAPLAVIDLIRALQRLVDALHDMRHRVRGIETLIGIHLTREVRIRGDLPAAQVDRFESGAHLLHGLIAGECA